MISHMIKHKVQFESKSKIKGKMINGTKEMKGKY